jgi:hypothetical protein
LPQKNKDITTYATLIMVPYWLDEIQVEYAKDCESYSIINNLAQNQKFEFRNDILQFKEKNYLTPSSKLKTNV